ncbi:MAG: phosphatidylserine/phosphatidylglycerophosphate/cardiolipin synthase family protein [Thermomicrobia bacterium]|nr:phosphatidylserine/phosphatidylglycerophosphate/cardiolipin synthase family protein [Thermomicrobia bacterium]
MDTLQQPQSSGDNLDVTLLAQGEQTGDQIAAQLAAFIGGAERSLDMALYDFRLSDPLKAVVAGAMRERAAAGVAIRIAYDADKPEPPLVAQGMDPAPSGTGAFVQSLGYPYRRIGGPKLMHNKYIIRDLPDPDGANDAAGASVWTGSTNFTDDAWNVEENNILRISSPDLARCYAHDFADLWSQGEIGTSGSFDTASVNLTYSGAPLTAHVFFSPGRGPQIDDAVAQRVSGARQRVRIWSMLINSGALISALGDLLAAGNVPISGLYDRTQMASVLTQWQDVPHNVWKIGAVRQIVAQAGLIGKNSTPYRPDTIHDFMHAKVLVVDDTVITGSYNFSRSAEFNAENLLMLENSALADRYSAFVDHLMAKYAAGNQPL